ncbi:hypothetical protein GCM10009546_43290 [Actinomadura livida]|uniref:Uncharacterized protein n=1 Tax=Actinomadura livida TaxID=79909 RepID=A0ABN1EXJ4_9ACTN
MIEPEPEPLPEPESPQAVTAVRASAAPAAAARILRFIGGSPSRGGTWGGQVFVSANMTAVDADGADG